MTKGVNKLLIIGVFAGQCVLATARAALKIGYTVIMLSDGVAVIKEEKLQKAFQKHREGSTTVISPAELIERSGYKI
jgi:nicotinamidase-related amidase